MPVASPFLNALLDTRGAQARQARQEAEVQIDELLYARRDIDDARVLLRQRRGAQLQDIESSRPTLEARWAERLRRLDEWKARLAPLREEGARLDALGKTWRWFERAQQAALPFNRRLGDFAERLENRRKSLEDSLKAWELRLEERSGALRAFEEKNSRRSAALLVSRARKRPEEIFVQQETMTAGQMETAFADLRGAASRALGRLYKAYAVLEKRSQESPALFEVRRRHLEQDFKATLALLSSLRERILNDALLLQSNRRTLEWIREHVNRMKCVEEVYRAPQPRWRRWMNRLTA